jgi:hypothetical protein
MARRTREEIEAIKDAIISVCADQHPMTVRQLFYQLASVHQVIAKSEAEYKGTVGRLTKDLRLSGALPWPWLVDNTRWIRKPSTYGSLTDCLEQSASAYRRSLWSNRNSYVEIWLEKDALSGVFYDITSEYDVPLMVTRGYPSLSYVKAAADQIITNDRPTWIYYFGDYDPSGTDISRDCEAKLRRFAPDAEIHFLRVAVEPWQIDEWNLPSRPTKQKDSRSKSFGDHRSVEIDAIPPDALRALIRGAIAEHISADEIATLAEVEAAERETLRRMAWNLQGVG